MWRWLAIAAVVGVTGAACAVNPVPTPATAAAPTGLAGAAARADAGAPGSSDRSADAAIAVPDRADAWAGGSPDGEAAPDSAAATPTCALAAPATVTAPGLVTPAGAAAVLAKTALPELKAVWAAVAAKAGQSPGPVKTYTDAYQLANLVKAKALVGWLKGDVAHSHAVAAALAGLPAPQPLMTDTNTGIHLGDALVGFAVAAQLASAATPTDALWPVARARHADWCGAFYQWVTADLALAYSFWPNNHSTKAAAGLGMCALALPGDPAAGAWLGWAAATIRDVWEWHAYAPSGSYAEGPHYHMYAMTSVIPFLVALHRAAPGGVCGDVVCATRLGWQPGCVDHRGPVADLLLHPLLHAGIRWSAEFLQPDGVHWPWGDSLPVGFPFGAIAGPLGHPQAAWAFVHHPFIAWTADLGVETILWWDPALVPAAPTATWRFQPDGGTAMWRHGAGADVRQVGLLAVPPAYQKCGHRQADALHVEVFARGKARLRDSGYSKWGDHDKVNKAEQHNTVFVDGKGTIVPALVGDTQACGLLDGDAKGGVAFAIVQGVPVHRQVSFVGEEIVVTDTFALPPGPAREVAVRWHGAGGLTAAEDPRGVFTVLPDGARWQDDSGAVWVRVVAEGAPIAIGHDLQPDGLAYGVLLNHRSLVASASAHGSIKVVSRIWVGPPGAAPPWSGG